MGKPVIVAVDGPAGSGKSSICAKAADRLGWTYVNTGAIYRSVSVILASLDVDVADESAVEPHVADIADDLGWIPETQRMLYKGEDITDRLGTVEASRYASMVAKMPGVRKRLFELQRRLALMAPVGAIVDGRDIGTVIFPDADLKIFLTASLEERAKRRHAQLGSPEDISLEQIKADIAERDDQDAGRGAAPLKLAEDAIPFDTSSLSIDEVIEKFLTMLQEKGVGS